MRFLSKISLTLLLSTLSSTVLATNQAGHDAVKLAIKEKYIDAQYFLKKSDNPEVVSAAIETIKIYNSQSLPDVEELKRFIKKVDWLPQEVLIKKIERKMNFDTSSDYIIDWFSFKQPNTDYAKLLLMHANFEKKTLKVSNSEDTKAMRHYWTKTNLDLATEESFLKKYKNLLTVEDCLRKVERLTWEKKQDYAQKLLNILPRSLHANAQSRINLSKSSKTGAINIKPYLKSDNSDEFARYMYVSALLKENKEYEAIKTLAHVKNSKYASSWWNLKNIGIRDSIKNKNYQIAYNLCLDHNLPHGADYAEAEWLAGWIALRYLNDYKAAHNHFQNLYDNTKLANSRSKAAYWIARAKDALNDPLAGDWYINASKYPGTFYGLIALAKLHGEQRVNYFNDNAPTLYNTDKKKHARAEKIIETLILLDKNGGSNLAKNIIKNLPDMKIEGAEYKHIAEALAKQRYHGLSVDVGLIAANVESVLLKASYPQHIDIHSQVVKLPKSLYLGLIRQESNFDKNAISSAGARGLMQLMPGTAERMAKSLGLHKHAYINDPRSNVLKGSAYLNGLHSQYGSMVLAIAAYNAGPGNVKKWIAIYGDPSTFKDEHEIIDWIESIPFKETRNYVKKVFENMIVYDSLMDKHHNARTILKFLEK